MTRTVTRYYKNKNLHNEKHLSGNNGKNRYDINKNMSKHEN